MSILDWFRVPKPERPAIRVPHKYVKGREHGTVSMYMGAKCRCGECKAANSAYSRQWRAARRGQQPPSHGYTSYVNYGCRCEVCSKAASEYNRSRRSKAVAS